MPTKKKAESLTPSRVEFIKIAPAVGHVDPQKLRGYAVWFKIDGFGPLNIVAEDWDEDHLLHHSRITCMVDIVDKIRAIDGVEVTNISQPVIMSTNNPLESFNVEFKYKHHGPFSVWEPYTQCDGVTMVPRAQFYVDKINKIMSINI